MRRAVPPIRVDPQPAMLSIGLLSTPTRVALQPITARRSHHREKDASAHHHPTIALGRLANRQLLRGHRQVPAIDGNGTHCWIDAAAVWTDGEQCWPEHPEPIGLATAPTWDRALLIGLSDRVGWEAQHHWEHGATLPSVKALSRCASVHLRLLDGRLDHGLPTVVATSATRTTWGAGATWEAAYGRALYGRAWPSDPAELATVAAVLASAGLGLAAVEIGSSVLSAHELPRFSVQLTSRASGSR
jgi:hypothetical protein